MLFSEVNSVLSKPNSLAPTSRQHCAPLRLFSIERNSKLNFDCGNSISTPDRSRTQTKLERDAGGSMTGALSSLSLSSLITGMPRNLRDHNKIVAFESPDSLARRAFGIPISIPEAMSRFSGSGKCPPFSVRCLENSVDMVSMILVCDSFCEILTAQPPGLIQAGGYNAGSRKSAASDGMLTIGIPNCLAALVAPISMANFAACFLNSGV